MKKLSFKKTGNLIKTLLYHISNLRSENFLSKNLVAFIKFAFEVIYPSAVTDTTKLLGV